MFGERWMNFIKIIVAVMVLSTAMIAEEEMVEVNFRDLTVKDFLEMISKITQRNILIETSVDDRKINFISHKKIRKSQLFSLANSILAGKKLTIIEQGDYYKIVKSKDAALEGLEVSDSIEGDTMKTVMFPLKASSAAVFRAKIKPLLSKNAKVISFKEENIVSVTAKPRSLQAISKLIKMIESSSRKKYKIIKLKHASAKELFPNVQKISKELFPQNILSEKVSVFKDEAINAIILVGKPENNLRISDYIDSVDIKGESTSQKMYVVRLKNSNVEEMEKIMSKLIAQLNSIAMKKPKKGSKSPTKAMVVSDVERNALIILATAEQMKNIRKTIHNIDVPKVQVYVKAKIVEVNMNLAKQIGLKYGIEGGAIGSNGLFSLASNLGASTLAISPALLAFLDNSSSSTNPTTGVTTTSNDRTFAFDRNINKLFALGASLDFLQQNGVANILSEPSILCTNNKEASIHVGQTMSILTQAQQATQGSSNLINNYSREDIGITLNVKPRLSSNNQVTLEVETEIEDVLPGSEATADRPTTTKRTVKTNAIVKNGETIILGGLIKKSGGEGSSKIPILGDIPVLGESLFTHKSDGTQEQNVIIYLTPYIVRRSADLEKLKILLREIQEVQIAYNKLVYKKLENREGSVYKRETLPRSATSISQSHKDNLSILDDMEEDY